MPRIPRSFASGLVTSRDPSTLRDGECSILTGCEFRPGSPHLYKHPGRSSTSSALGAAVRAINKCQYDSGTDTLVAQAGATIYESAVSTAPSWTASSLTSLSTSAIPRFVGAKDRWYMCNGTDSNYVRDPDGTWRALGIKAANAPTVTGSALTGTLLRATSDTGDWTNGANARDSDEATSAYGSADGDTHTWTFASATYSGDYLYVRYKVPALFGAEDTSGTGFEGDPAGTGYMATLHIEYSTNGGTTWTTLKRSSSSAGTKTASTLLPDGTYVLVVRATHTLLTTVPTNTHIYDIKVGNGATGTTVTTTTVYYGVTEVYEDADGKEYEGNMSELAELAAGTYASASITFGAKRTTHANYFRVYRSVDTAGGGYPNMWGILTVPAGDATAADIFEILPSATPDGGQYPLYPSLELLSPTGDTLTINVNGEPPLSKLILLFQGSLMYFPAAASAGSRVFYSLIGGVDATALEKVPDFYYLNFETPKNDTPTGGAVTNGGKSALVFFADYTMLLSYLPQATDPGIFDNRVKEYVSNSRGAAGVGCVCEFTLPSGQTLVAAVDALGLWVTNGINVLSEWSRDLDWTTDLSGVTISSGELVDNPEMRRLEFLYTGSDGSRYEYHFYYGRMKEDGDGQSSPLITGPHKMGVRCKHYTQVSGVWKGFSGDSSSTGDVFIERDGDEDEADGYDSSGSVPFRAKTGDIYVGGLGGAHLVEAAYPKFASGDKSVSLIGTFVRDAGTTRTLTKTFVAGSGKKTYWHAYCDRHALEVQDISATSMPALVGYEVEVREAGEGRDK